MEGQGMFLAGSQCCTTLHEIMSTKKKQNLPIHSKLLSLLKLCDLAVLQILNNL